MYIVKVGKEEGALEKALKRLKSKIIEDGLMEELYRLRSYENPKEKKKRKLRIRSKVFVRNKS